MFINIVYFITKKDLLFLYALCWIKYHGKYNRLALKITTFYLPNSIQFNGVVNIFTFKI